MTSMLGRTKSMSWGVALDTPDAQALARFYARLLGWTIHKDDPEWATVAPPDGVAYLGFQTSPEFVRPVWPAADGAQQQMMHLDLEVDDLDTAVAHAVDVGATPGRVPAAERRPGVPRSGRPPVLPLPGLVGTTSEKPPRLRPESLRAGGR